MDKEQRKQLNAWLKDQSKLAKRWLTISIVLGLVSTLFLIAQAGLLASILHQLIIESVVPSALIASFVYLLLAVAGRAACQWGREIAGYRCGEQVRIYIRHQIIEKLTDLGPAYIKGKPAGAWASLLLEQVEEMQDFFSRYLPQMALSVLIPFMIIVVVFPANWAAGLIFLITAPLVPLFMALAGMKAADANKRNFKALQRLSGHFYDRLQAMTTIRLFNRAEDEAQTMQAASEVFRKSTMEILRIAFLSSAILEFFTSISIALTAVYFGFSFIGELNFGYYGAGITLFTGLFVLILAPEFYQPLRDLGTFYHAKAQALGAAESIVEFLDAKADGAQMGDAALPAMPVHIKAKDLTVFSPEGDKLVGPISFEIAANQSVALVGPSGAGKTSLVNAILGFLPYTGSLQVNQVELKTLSRLDWHQHISWVGQNPLLLHGTIYENITLGQTQVSEDALQQAIKASFADEFIARLGLDHPIGDRSSGLSVGQAQRIALARAMLQNGRFWLLDEPSASLDANSEKLVSKALRTQTQDKTCLMVTHRLDDLANVEQIIVLENGLICEHGDFESLSSANGLFAQMLAANQPQQGDLDA